VMANDPAYQNYYSITNKSADPFRKGHTTLVFDRTNWRLTQFNYNAATTSFERSVARNIANINLMTAEQVSANVNMRAVDRIFKFDPQVNSLFVAEVNNYFGNNAGTNVAMITNTEVMYDVISNGGLALTQELIKEKVGGGWRGDTVDANVFTRFVEGLDSTTDYLTNFGWDTDPWDTVSFDRTVEVVNYEGIFNELLQGPITLRRNNETYEGFDGVTFKRVLYGEERPEELALLDPLESLIIDVYTSPYPLGNTSATPVSPDAVAVRYQMHQNLFGETEYLRILDNRKTTLAANVYTYSTEITVADVTVLQTPRPGDPGIIWIGTERVQYERVVGNVLSLLTRGAAGTTVQDHLITDAQGSPVTVEVWEGSEEETFNRLDAEQANWLEIGSTFFTFDDYNVSSIAYSDANVVPNQLILTTTVEAAAATFPGDTIGISANSNVLVAEGTSFSTSYTSNVTFFYVTDVDYANAVVTVEDDLFLQFGLWDYGAYDASPFDAEYPQVAYSNVLLQIPTLNIGSNTALSLSDVANADYADPNSLMKFIHNV